MILYLNAHNNEVTWNKKNYLLAAAKRLGLADVRDVAELHGAQPEVVLNIQPCDVMLGSVWSGLWHIDVILDNVMKHQAANMQAVFIASSQEVNPIPDAQVLFQACDPSLHRRISDIPQEFDYVLCGSMGHPVYSARENAHALMSQHFKYYDFGKNHDPYTYIRNLNTARVQFIHTATGSHGKGNAAQRFFECLAIGPVLTNWTEDLPLTGLVEGEDYVAYRNGEEMLEKMLHLVINGDYRQKVAINGRRKALLYHTYEHRLISILNTINEHLTRSTQ